MLEVAIGSFFNILRKPSLLFPGIFLTIAQAAIWAGFFYLNDTLPRFFYELFVLNIFPKAGFFETIFLLIIANPIEFIFLGAFAVLWFAATMWMIFSFTEIIGKKQPALKSVFGSLGRLGKILGISAFFAIAMALFSAILLFFLWLFVLGGLFGLIGFFGTMLWLPLGLFAYFKLIVLPVEFFSTEEKINASIKKAWDWTGKRFFSTIVFTLLALAVSNAIVSIGVIVSDIIAIEIVSTLVIFFAMSAGSAYFGVALVSFYFSKN